MTGLVAKGKTVMDQLVIFTMAANDDDYHGCWIIPFSFLKNWQVNVLAIWILFLGGDVHQGCPGMHQMLKSAM